MSHLVERGDLLDGLVSAPPAGDRLAGEGNAPSLPVPAYAVAGETSIAWDGRRLQMVVAPPPLSSELFMPVMGVVLIPVIGLLMAGGMARSLWEWMPRVLPLASFAVIGLLALSHCVAAIVRALRFAGSPIVIEADARSLRITCPAQWGLEPWCCTADEVHRVEVYEAGRTWDGSHILYLRIWTDDYFDPHALHFTTRDPDLAYRLETQLQQALGIKA